MYYTDARCLFLRNNLQRKLKPFTVAHNQIPCDAICNQLGLQVNYGWVLSDVTDVIRLPAGCFFVSTLKDVHVNYGRSSYDRKMGLDKYGF